MPPKNKTLIVAEDDYNVLMSMCIVLERLGYDAIPAESGLEVMQLLKVMSPDAITLDLQMPFMGGLETLKQIKGDEQFKNIPVIIVSADSQADVIEECRDLGCACFLPKPTGMADLNEALEKYIFPKNRRKYPRIDVAMKVAINCNGIVQNLYTRTLSEKGVFIRTNHPFPVNSEVEVVLPLDEEKITVHGRVIYVTGFEDHQPGMAVEFKDIPDDSETKIKQFVLKSISKDMEGLVA